MALAAVMAVDVISFSVMGNHLHVLLRNRPDEAAKLTAREVARRWKSLNSKKFELREVTEEQIDEYLKDEEQIEVWRKNLSDISRFMRMLKEPISIAANAPMARRGIFGRAASNVKTYSTRNFGRLFGYMVGKPEKVAERAAQAGIRSWGGMKQCRRAFA